VQAGKGSARNPPPIKNDKSVKGNGEADISPGGARRRRQERVVRHASGTQKKKSRSEEINTRLKEKKRDRRPKKPVRPSQPPAK